MYSIKVEPPDKSKPVIRRSMSSNKAVELIPVLIQIAKDTYKFIKPVPIYMGSGKFVIVDSSNPNLYAVVDIEAV